MKRNTETLLLLLSP